MPEKIYEMLWDCEFCGTRKLLGKTHRFCPNCGAAQNPAKRYFPEEAEKVAVEDHVYVGADRICPSCAASSSAAVKFCGGCGDDMAGGRNARLIPSGGEPAPSSVSPSPKKSHGWIFGLILAAASVVGMLFFKTKPVDLSVSGHAWTREIQIERFSPIRESAWCDQMPLSARELSRKKEVRSTEQVPDGEDCRTVKRDRGDGTYAESRECTPKAREKKIWDDRCEYAVNRWSTVRTERAGRDSMEPEPFWPAVQLEREGDCVGCERPGPRTENYEVLLREGTQEHRCALSQEKWAAMAPGSRWRGEARSLTGGLVCDRLTPGP